MMEASDRTSLLRFVSADAAQDNGVSDFCGFQRVNNRIGDLILIGADIGAGYVWGNQSINAARSLECFGQSGGIGDIGDKCFRTANGKTRETLLAASYYSYLLLFRQKSFGGDTALCFLWLLK